MRGRDIIAWTWFWCRSMLLSKFVHDWSTDTSHEGCLTVLTNLEGFRSGTIHTLRGSVCTTVFC